MTAKLELSSDKIALIRHCYAQPRLKRNVKAVAAKVGISPGHLHEAAVQLQIVNPTATIQNPWTDAELALLKNNAHLTALTISRKLRKVGFYRSPVAVEKKRLALFGGRQEAAIEKGFISAQTIADGMGVNITTVCKWIRLGYMRGQKLDYGRFGNYLIKAEDFKDFLRNNPARCNLSKADQYWLLDLILGPPKLKGKA